MVVLLLFNDAEQLSYREIAEATEIPAQELKRSLQSLACAKGERCWQAPCAYVAVRLYRCCCGAASLNVVSIACAKGEWCWQAPCMD
jgi:hypothetical protein